MYEGEGRGDNLKFLSNIKANKTCAYEKLLKSILMGDDSLEQSK